MYLPKHGCRRFTENFLMDNEKECKTFLMTRERRDQIIAYYMNAILKVK